MKTVARSFAFVLMSTFAVGSSPRDANACSLAETALARGLRASLSTFVLEKKYAEADLAYTKLVALDASCVTPADHSLGGVAARKEGNLHNAYLRFTVAGDQAAIADLDKAYGQVRILNAAQAPSPRELSWSGVIVTNRESTAVLQESKRRIAEGGKSVAYLMPGSYFVKSGDKVLLRFDVKGGDRLVLEYK